MAIARGTKQVTYAETGPATARAYATGARLTIRSKTGAVVAHAFATGVSQRIAQALGVVLNTDTAWQPGGLGATVNTTVYGGTTLGAASNTASYPP